MLCVRLVRAFGVVAAFIAGGEAALAQTAAADLPPLDDGLRGGARPEQVLLFGGFDLWRNSLAGYGAVQWAADGLNSDGFIIRLVLSEGTERYRTPTTTFSTDIFRASILPGWRFQREKLEIKLLAGLDFEHHNLTPDVIDAKLRGGYPGVRVAAETWLEPVPEIMLTTSFYFTSIGSGYGARVASGWRLFDQFWVGPELSGSGDQFSRQVKLGAHLTGLKIAEWEWSGAAGWVTDSFHRSGPYARVGFLTRQ